MFSCLHERWERSSKSRSSKNVLLQLSSLFMSHESCDMSIYIFNITGRNLRQRCTLCSRYLNNVRLELNQRRIWRLFVFYARFGKFQIRILFNTIKIGSTECVLICSLLRSKSAFRLLWPSLVNLKYIANQHANLQRCIKRAFT